MAGMSRCELEGFYRAHVHYVRGLLRKKSKRWRLQEADQEDVAQNVFRSVFTSWPSPQPLNERAYLTTIVVNAAEEHHRRKNKVTCDQRLNVPMVAEEASGPIEVELVERVNLEDEVGVRRLRQNLEKIARALQPKDAEVFRRMMIDVDDVPAKERNRVIAAVRRLMGVPVVPPSVEYPGEIVEGPSHCGRAVRRLEDEQRAANDEDAEYELDAAE
jgi:DNA-directed RNA polymerase specialized sigma24 family protein